MQSNLFSSPEGQVFLRYLQERLRQAQANLEMEPAENSARVAYLQGQCKVYRTLLSDKLAEDIRSFLKQHG